jgi:hypothetical protein
MAEISFGLAADYLGMGPLAFMQHCRRERVPVAVRSRTASAAATSTPPRSITG